MTIAIGLKARGGMVIGVDSQETIGNVSKTNCCKTLNVADKMVITGAGDSEYLDAIFYAIGRDFTTRGRDTPFQVEEDIRAVLTRFYREHVIPFAKFPAEERPDFSLLIAAHVNGHNALWKTSRNAISTVQHYAALGFGEYMATILFERFNTGEHMISVRTAKYLVGYVLYYVKKFVPGCGGDSSLVCFDPLGNLNISGDLTVAEDIFAAFDRLVSTQTILLATAPEFEGDELAATLTQLDEELRKLHERLRKQDVGPSASAETVL